MQGKLCKCGCGGETLLRATTNKRRGWIKGQPNEYIIGHSMRGRHHTEEWKKAHIERHTKPSRINPQHLCECGCGEVTIIAPYTKKRMGLKIGEPHRFIRGHNKAQLGLKWSEESRKKLSVSRTGMKIPNRKSPSSGAWNKGTHKSGMEGKRHKEESKRKCSESNKGQKRSDECKEKLRNHAKERWSNKEYREKHIKILMSIPAPNKKEIRLGKLLDELYPGEWKFVGNGQVIVAGKCPDFININGQKKIIELYGDYWHHGQNPQDRIDVFSPYGYETLIVWEKELKDMPGVAHKVRAFCGGGIS